MLAADAFLPTENVLTGEAGILQVADICLPQNWVPFVVVDQSAEKQVYETLVIVTAP